MTALKIGRAMRKPFYVDVVRVTKDNMAQVAEWCSGELRMLNREGSEPVPYIQVQVIRPVNDRQTRAFAGDWVIKTETGWKVYTHKAYKDSFDNLPEVPLEYQTQEDLQVACA